MAALGLRHMGAINAQIIADFTPAEARSLQALLLRAHDNLKGP